MCDVSVMCDCSGIKDSVDKVEGPTSKDGRNVEQFQLVDQTAPPSDAPADTKSTGCCSR